MVLIDRWIEILEYLKIKKFATVEEMMEKFKISRSTLRRDLIAMEERGHIKRPRGGAELVEQIKDNIEWVNLEEIFKNNKDDKIKIAKKPQNSLRIMM